MQSPGMWRAKLRLGPSPSQTRTAAQVLGNPGHVPYTPQCMSSTDNVHRGLCDREGGRQASRHNRRA